MPLRLLSVLLPILVAATLPAYAQDENAFDYYETAGALLPGDPLTDELATQGRALAVEAEAAVSEVQEALHELRLGLPHECVMPAVTSFSEPMPYLADFRRLARALIVEGWMHEHAGRWDQALGSYRDMLKLGQDSARGGVLIHMLVSLAIENMASRQIEYWLSHADTTHEELQGLATWLAEFEQNEVPCVEILLNESVASRAAVQQLPEDADAGPVGLKELGLKPGFNPEPVVKQIDEFYARVVKWIDQPYAAAKANPLPPPPPGPVNALAPAVLKALEAATTGIARARATRLLVALKLYRVRHGAWPPRLSDLAPETLAELPTDPFTDKPFVYRIEADRAIVYSLGPDQKDDGGVAQEPGETGRRNVADIVFIISPSK